MENWGLITYRTTAVLFDEKTSDAKYKNRVAYVGNIPGFIFLFWKACPTSLTSRTNADSTTYTGGGARTRASMVWQPCYYGLVEW